MIFLKLFQGKKSSTDIYICSSNDQYLVTNKIESISAQTVLINRQVTLNCDKNEENGPKIIVSYYDNKNTHITYKEYILGNKDKAKLYLSNGKFSYEHEDDVSIKENQLSLSLTHIFNYLDIENVGLGIGWKTNLHQYLIKTNEYNNTKNGNEIKYIDGEGIFHYFYQKYYYVKNNIKNYITRDEVFLDYDQKLKVLIENALYEVEYEIENEKGFQLFLGEDIASYELPKIKRTKYFVEYGFGEVEIDIEKPLYAQFFYLNENHEKIYVKPKDVFKEEEFGYYVTKDKKELFLDTTPRPITISSDKVTFTYLNGNTTETQKIIEKIVEEENESKNKTIYKDDNISNIELQIDQYINQINELEKTKEETFDNYKKLFKQSFYTLENVSLNDQLKNYSSENESDDIESLQTEMANNSLNASNLQMTMQIESYYKQYMQISKSYFDAKRSLDDLKKKDALIDNQKKSVNAFIIDSKGNTLGFDAYGRLILIQDKYENKINIEFGYKKINKDKMISIYSDSQTIKFNYDSETGLLVSLNDPYGRIIKYNYSNNILTEINKNNYLTSISYENGIKVITPELNILELITSELEKVNKIKISCYDGIFNENTKLNGTEDKKDIIDDSISFIKRDNLCEISISNQINNKNEYYCIDVLGNLLTFSDDKNMTISSYEKQKKVMEVKFKKIYTPIDSVNYDIQNDTYTFLLDKQSLPSSNMVGVLFKVNKQSLFKKIPFKIKTKVTINDNEKISVNDFENEYQFLTENIVQPICIRHDCSNQLEITLSSDDLDFQDGLFKKIQIVEIESGKIYKYDNALRLIQEQDGYSLIKYLDFNENDVSLTKVESNIFGEEITITYNYNNKNQLTYIEDSKGNVEEYFYDEKENCIEKRVYNKKDASLMNVEKVSYDEHGNLNNIIGNIKDKDGNYPIEEITYLPGTDIKCKIKGVNGETTIYQYDYNTGNLLSISSSINGINNSTVFTYNYGLLTSMSHHGMKVNYEYDGKGRQTKISLNGEDIVWKTYNDEYEYGYTDPFNNDTLVDFTGKQFTSSTLDGFYVENYQDNDEKNIINNYSGNDTYGAIKYSYNDKDLLVNLVSKINYRDTDETYKEETFIEYDKYDSIIKQEKKINEISNVILNNYYDNNHRNIISSDSILPQEDYRLNTLNTYNDELQLKSISIREGIIDEEDEDCFLPVSEITYDYDILGRIKHQNLHANKIDICHEYSYLQQDENALDLINEDLIKIKIKQGNQTTYLIDTSTYQYDVNGNITLISTDENNVKYQYDSLNRLIREDNLLLNQTIIYQYDKAGNILLKKISEYITEEKILTSTIKEYVYDCEKRDRLISYDNKQIKYDAMGRPITYKDDEYEWNNQGQLTYILTQNEDEIEYYYDINGIRRKKIVNGVETTYTTNGNQILSIKQGNTIIIYRYALNKLVGFNYNDGSSSKEYIYQRNIQGDITAIYDDRGNEVGGYQYDAYGNFIITKDIDGIATINPFRYRGYYFDNESNLYYLNSRYYNSETGRFISPDILSILDKTRFQINGLNLYMYCKDNPIMYYDPNGNLPKWLQWLISALEIGAGVALCFVPGMQGTRMLRCLAKYS